MAAMNPDDLEPSAGAVLGPSARAYVQTAATVPGIAVAARAAPAVSSSGSW
jgi:hypothetical protein